MRLTPGQIAGVLRKAGWPAVELPLATAIVLAESGGRTDAVGDTRLETEKWGPSIGLFQIRSLRAQKGTGGVRDETANYNPVTNAQHALQIRRTQGLVAWTVYNTGAYFRRLPEAIAGVRDIVDPTDDIIGAARGALSNATDAVKDVTSGIEGVARSTWEVAGSVAKAGAWLSERNNWIRIAKVGVGTTLIIVGFGKLTEPWTKPAFDQAVSMAGGAAKTAITKKKAS